MGTVQKLDVCVNIAQDFSDEQKKRGRNNIGTNRVVFVTYGISTHGEISSAVSDGDSVILQVPVTGSAAYVPLSHASSAGYVFRSPVSSSGDFSEYAVIGSTWTTVTKNVYRDQFTTKTLDTTRVSVNADDEITTVGNIKLSYYYDNQAKLRLVWVPASETQASLTIYSDHGYFSWANVTTSQPQSVGADNFSKSTGLRETLRWYTDLTFVVLEFFYDEMDHILHWRRVS